MLTERGVDAANQGSTEEEVCLKGILSNFHSVPLSTRVVLEEKRQLTPDLPSETDGTMPKKLVVKVLNENIKVSIVRG